MSGPITFGGLASGMDTNSIVSKLVEIEKQPMVLLQNQVQAEQSQQGILSDLTTKLNTLQTSLGSLTTQMGIQGRTVNIASGAPFSATASATATAGNYSVVVSQLAQAQRTYSNTYSDPNQTGLFQNGTINITQGGKSASISVTGSDTLNTLASKINSSGLNLNTAVVYDGTNYRMVVNGNNTGQANAITFHDTGSGLGLDVAADTVLAANDAQLKVDGLAVTSATNTVSGIIPGVTMSLAGNSGTAYTLTVANDPTKLQTSLQAVVTAYNAVMTEVNQQMPKPGASSQPGPGTLAGDPAMLQLQSTMLGLPATAGGPAGNTYSMLADIGVTVDSTGIMSLDTSKLQTVLSNDPTAVSNLLIGTNGSNGLAAALGNLVSMYTDPVNGVLQADSQGIAQEISAQNDSIAQMSTMVDAYQQQLQTQFSAMEQMISTYQNQTSSLTGLISSASSSSSRGK